MLDLRKRLLLLVTCAALIGALLPSGSGCGVNARVATVRVGPSESVRVRGLDRCQRGYRGPVKVDPDQPLTILVHGCNGSGGDFKTLAQVYRLHGRPAICFNYNDRDRLDTSARQLRRALHRLAGHLRRAPLTVIGHSQGGLVARRALTRERFRDLPLPASLPVRLATVSSPFNGIQAARHCSLLALHILSFGVSAGICQAAVGNLWYDIHPKARAVRRPGALIPRVEAHLKVVTDERGTCRRRTSSGACEESDFVFSRAEQYHPGVDGYASLHNVEVKAGHVEIVGDAGMVPKKLLRILRRQRFMPETPVALRPRIARLYR
jgi:hypothetical protein